MKIEHIAIYTTDLERECEFFEKYFGAKRGEKYHNPKTGFQSYFLTFDGGARQKHYLRRVIASTVLFPSFAGTPYIESVQSFGAVCGK